MRGRASVNRRNFLKLAVTTSGVAALAPFLKACSRLATPAPTPTAAPSAVQPTATQIEKDLAGLRGLDIDTFFKDAYRLWANRDPETLTTLGLADLYGAGDGQLTDISDAFIRQTQSLEKGTLALIRAYDRAALSQEQAVTADIFEWFLDDLVRGHVFMYDDYPVNPIITSVPYNLYGLFTIYQPLNNRQDAEDYIARLSQVGAKFAQLIDGLKRREERGVILPGFLLPLVRPGIEGLARGEPASHDYATTFSSRLKGVTEEERQALTTQAQEQVKAVVMPAYSDLADFLQSQQAKAPNQVGVWQFADGEAYYAQSLRRHTTTEMSAE